MPDETHDQHCSLPGSIVKVHNYYRHAGGEDRSFRLETEMLERHGHSTRTLCVDSRALSAVDKLLLPATAIWNPVSYRKVVQALEAGEPSICHFHNTFPVLSPSVYYAARAMDVAIVQTIPNYRLLCPAATFLRNGKICERCSNKMLPWPSVVHGCYHHGRLATASVAAMLFVHRLLQTYVDRIDAYVVLTDFMRQKLVAGGLPANRIHVKPNFVHPDPGVGSGDGEYALFVGRFSPEKGLDILLQAWSELDSKIPLKLVGGTQDELRRVSPQADLEGAHCLGHLSQSSTIDVMKRARILIVPSLWYEPFGRVIVEAFAVGLPVIASRIGGIPSIVDDGHSGLLFECGNPSDLASKVRWIHAHPSALGAMRDSARREFTRRYSAEANYEMLARIYRQAIIRARERRQTAGPRQ